MNYKNEKYKRINKKSKVITDKLGCKIDKGIRTIIVLLNFNGIITYSSCNGHKNRGYCFPWINIKSDYIDVIRPLIKDLDITIKHYFDDSFTIYPICKELIKGRKEFKKLKNKLK